MSPSIEPSSPTIPPSPTMGASSPVMTPATEDHRSDLIASSIALSVVLGLLLLGVSTWAGLAYRRRMIRARTRNDEEGGEPSDKVKGDNIETLSSSNVCEKGLVPRLSSSSADSDTSGSTIRPQSTAHGHHAEAPSRRASFIEVPINTNSMLALHEKLYEPATSGTRKRRSRSSTLSAIERSLVGPRDSSGSWLSTVLDDIEEEVTIGSSSSKTALPDYATVMTQAEKTPGFLRPDSVASSSVSSHRANQHTPRHLAGPRYPS